MVFPRRALLYVVLNMILPSYLYTKFFRLLDTKLGKNGKISRADVAQTLVDALPSEIKQNQTFEILAGEQPIEEAVS